MTNIIFKKKDENLISFKIDGHSGFDEYNKDIVCSAISAVSQTTLIGILEVLKISMDYCIEDGFLSLSLEESPVEDIEKCQVLLQAMLLGLKSMELSYGDYINVKVEEV
ncbi:ribosomal-processing cysteine protease Prp [Clostridium ganghwense]|uniref:Ribosomal processing cysteine protease Prp n=1 Tax=Clostridium ganghwense TaxID=312089 RepID=A0ABT4CUF2_9CLOT|nr:ribosomal-processing cysteine protease Prp [Clostridium ganghwense]MCY6371861.1 ribosomal-processing cysteine protease Prp [Clostridium ganghwense]